MSGPKISIYSLTGRAKEIVMGQMRFEQESLVCYNQIQEVLKSFQTLPELYERQTQNARLLIKRTSKGMNQLETIQNIQKKVQIEIEQIKDKLAVHMPHVCRYVRDRGAQQGSA